MRKEFRSLISLDEARSIVLSHAPRSHVVAVPLSQARGAVLAEKGISSVDVPGFHRASMDGFAVYAKDTFNAREDMPVALKLKGTIPMGMPSDVHVAEGEAVEVSTGSMMPPGANAVVMIEYSQSEGDLVQIRRAVHPGENVQLAGSDISFGETVLFPGTRLAVREIGVLAALGRETVRVRCLKAGVASTGNELVAPGTPLGPGQIYDINAYAVAAAVQECGATAITYGILPDCREEMSKTMQKMAYECDIVLVSGSTSAGAGDMVYQVLDEIGETIFHGVNLKPGKPTIFGMIDETPCLGLPGYPVSALTVFELLAAPAICNALGLRRQGHHAKGKLASHIRSEGRRQMMAVGISGDLIYPVDKGSGSITTLAWADGVIEIPSDVEYLEKGEVVDVRLFGEQNVPDLIIAGENTMLMERMVENHPLRVKLMNTGSARGCIFLEDGIADMVCVSGAPALSKGITTIMSYSRELGMISKDSSALQNIEEKRIVGWHKDSMMRLRLENALLAMGITNPTYSRYAKTHSSVAAAVAMGMADLGFVERDAAKQAGLCFLSLAQDDIHFLISSGRPEKPRLISFISSLQRALAGR